MEQLFDIGPEDVVYLPQLTLVLDEARKLPEFAVMSEHGLQVFFAWRLPLLENSQVAVKLVLIGLFLHQPLREVRNALASRRGHDLMYEELIRCFNIIYRLIEDSTSPYSFISRDLRISFLAKCGWFPILIGLCFGIVSTDQIILVHQTLDHQSLFSRLQKAGNYIELSLHAFPVFNRVELISRYFLFLLLALWWL